MADVHSDRLELVGDVLPTPQEQAELNAYHDYMDRQCCRDYMPMRYPSEEAMLMAFRGAACKLITRPAPRLCGLSDANFDETIGSVFDLKGFYGF